METPYRHGNDLCLGFWADAWDAGVVGFPPHAEVLEIGGAEADWVGPMIALRPDLRVTVLDCRRVRSPMATAVIQGDVRTAIFPSASFDAVIAVSTIEHIGLGGYGDPVDPDGDTRTMANIRTWIRPMGWCYLDVPYRPEAEALTISDGFRAYDPNGLIARLLLGWDPQYARVYRDTHHRDGPYISLVLHPRPPG